jgi:spore coat protein U-like protein
MSASYALRSILIALLCICALRAQAAIVCNVSSSGFTAYYFENDPNPTNGTGSFTVSCSRTAGDAITFAYTLASDDGLHESGGFNRAFNGAGGTGAARMNYNLYRDAGLTQRWGNSTALDFAGTVNFGTAATLFATHTQTYYTTIPAVQNKNAGLFTDTVTMRLCNSLGTGCGTGNLSNGTFPVTINNNSLCLLTTPPGSISFNYTSFQVANATANTSYTVRCTINQIYAMTLDAPGGTLLGLNYTLSLSAPGNRTGTGFSENFTINGTILGGGNTSGTCGGATCSQTQTRILTITY